MLKFLNLDYINKNKNPIFAFFYAVLIFLSVNVLKKILKISFFQGDIFFKLFSFLKAYEISEYIPYGFFIKFSFFSIFAWIVLLVFFIFVYAAQVQFFLHLTVKIPARFTKILNIFFVYTASFYFISLLPVFGSFMWFLILIYLLTNAISKINFISKIKAFLVLMLPFISFITFVLFFIIFLAF